eukprot:1440315-Alexandrium_andersonii.AAC.1
MSASLVGSEMCIRDRSRGRSPSRGHPSGLHQVFDRRAGGRQGKRTYSVSYTHLTLPTICSV